MNTSKYVFPALAAFTAVTISPAAGQGSRHDSESQQSAANSQETSRSRGDQVGDAYHQQPLDTGIFDSTRQADYDTHRELWERELAESGVQGDASANEQADTQGTLGRRGVNGAPSELESPADDRGEVPYPATGAHGAYGYGLSYNYAPYYGQDIGVERSIEDGELPDLEAPVDSQQQRESSEAAEANVTADSGTPGENQDRESGWLGTGADMDSSQTGVDPEGNDRENYVSNRRSDAAAEWTD